ncbi:MAG: hypothetical protein LC637_13930, partial [Xanthomonadaceae bacterium]|nr:hypothetical protein [Xanthomonadaceae bacterium]
MFTKLFTVARAGVPAVVVFGLLALSMAAGAQSLAVESTELEIGLDKTSIAEGRYRLDVVVPKDYELGPDSYYVYVHETGSGRTTSFAMLDTSRWFRRQTAGKIDYRAQLCSIGAEQPDVCGPLSATHEVSIPTGLVTRVPSAFSENGGVDGISSVGPSAIDPGAYVSTRTRLNAWHFNWANGLRLPQSPDIAPKPFFDLQIVWQTYEYDPQLGRTMPIWLVAQLKVEADDPGEYIGVLFHREFLDGEFVLTDVGRVEITANSQNAREVGVRWWTSLGGMYQCDSGNPCVEDWVTDTLEFSSVAGAAQEPDLAHDSYAGSWNDLPGSLPDQPVSVLFWMENQVERIDVLFQDEAGRPVWAIASRDGAAAGQQPTTMAREDFCALTVFDGPL